jgi:serine/threonine protein kinase
VPLRAFRAAPAHTLPAPHCPARCRIAPEVLLGGRECSAAVDIYSFGVLLWEIVTGERPQRGSLRMPRVPQECPQVGGRAGGGASCTRAVIAAAAVLALPPGACAQHFPGAHSTPLPHLPAIVHCLCCLPQEVSDLIMECLSESPSKRPTAQQLLQQLRGLLERSSREAAGRREPLGLPPA